MLPTPRRRSSSRTIDKPRRARTALMLAVAAAALSTTFAASASAATTYYEWESEKSALNLVMTAKGTAPGSKVGLGTDNNSSMALWDATPQGDGYWSYELRASEHLATPVCLDVEGDSKAQGAAIVLRACDGTPSQNWKELAGSGHTARLSNEWSHRYIHQPNGPEFLVNLRQTSLSESGEPLSGLLWTWRSVSL
jgi:hypothetical protein